MCGDEEEEDEKSSDKTERGYSGAAGREEEMKRFEKGGQEVC